MGNISKQLSEMIATDLLKKKQSEINQLKKELNTIGENLIIDSIPKDVLKVFESVENRIYFKHRNNFCINRSFDIRCINYYPYENYNCEISAEKVSKLGEIDNKIIKLKAEYNTEYISIVNILLQLKTEKRIIAEFPDFKKYFTTKECTSLAIPVGFIHDLINQ